MRIVIGYDGSDCALAAISDLQHAGLPADTRALVLSSVEPVSFDYILGYGTLGAGGAGTSVASDIPYQAESDIDAALGLAHQGANHVRRLFPSWRVDEDTSSQIPADAIITGIVRYEADLAVIGSHGHGPLGEFLAGSITRHVLHYAPCSVRVARQHHEHAPGPLRLVVAYDGSPHADAAVGAVAERQWPSGSSCCVLTVVETWLNTVLPMLEHRQGVEKLQQRADRAVACLRDAGLETTRVTREGDPGRAIVHEAQEWGADSVFMGSRGQGRTRRFLLGSVSTMVASRAPCSVEVIRGKSER